MARISKINVNNTEYDLGNQVSSMPTASADELGKVYQYIGATDSTYTHGYFYECKAGSTSGTYIWENVPVGQGSAAGVSSFNGRTGAVTPQNGDYTAAQVGAVAASGGDAVDAITSEISIPLWGYVKESGSSLISGIIATSYYDGADIATETHVMQVAKHVGSSPVIGETFATVSNNVITLKTYWDGGAEETVTLSNHLFVNLFSGTVYMMLADRNVISDNIILNPDPTEFIPESISAIKYKTFRNVLGHINNFLSYLKSKKADKVSPVTSGDVATLDSYGNIVDSGKTLGISVPTPAAGDENKVFSGAGIWVPQSGGAAISSIGSDESGRTTSSRAYAQGEHFYKDGKFCEAKTAIASGATLTLNTNYKEDTVANVITTLNSQLVAQVSNILNRGLIDTAGMIHGSTYTPNYAVRNGTLQYPFNPFPNDKITLYCDDVTSSSTGRLIYFNQSNISSVTIKTTGFYTGSSRNRVGIWKANSDGSPIGSYDYFVKEENIRGDLNNVVVNLTQGYMYNIYYQSYPDKLFTLEVTFNA